MKRARVHSPRALEAAQLLGTQIAVARRERRWPAKELAERAGISPATLAKVEAGDPTVALGIAFEVASLLGVPLFHDDPRRVGQDLGRLEDRLAVLPARIREPSGPVDDDF